MANVIQWRKVGTARPELGNLINAAHFSGTITILQIGKTDKAAIVPLSLVKEYQDLMARQPSYADPMEVVAARDNPSWPALPREVEAGTDAHSSALAEAFEQPPIEPSEDGEPSLDEIYAELMDGIDTGAPEDGR